MSSLPGLATGQAPVQIMSEYRSCQSLSDCSAQGRIGVSSQSDPRRAHPRFPRRPRVVRELPVSCPRVVRAPDWRLRLRRGWMGRGPGAVGAVGRRDDRAASAWAGASQDPGWTLLAPLSSPLEDRTPLGLARCHDRRLVVRYARHALTALGFVPLGGALILLRRREMTCSGVSLRGSLMYSRHWLCALCLRLWPAPVALRRRMLPLAGPRFGQLLLQRGIIGLQRCDLLLQR